MILQMFLFFFALAFHFAKIVKQKWKEYFSTL